MKQPHRFLVLVFFVLSIALPAKVAQAENFVGSNINSRVLLGFQVNQTAMQPLVPEGWTPVPFPAGPFKGANLLTILLDRELDLDPEGKAKSPAMGRLVALVGLGKQDDGDAVNLYIYRVYSSVPEYDPYGNSVVSDIARATSTGGPSNEGRARKEDWTISPQSGGQLDVSLAFTSGTQSWGPGEAKPHSSITPDFFRIYRYDQVADLVMSEPIGKPLKGSFSMESTVPELAEIFDGSEKIVGILDVPFYALKVYLP